MKQKNFDVIILGAGPAGCTAALKLGDTGLKIAIADKSAFPREKICGDAISGNAVNILKNLPNNIYNRFINDFDKKLPSFGVRITGPGLKHIELPFTRKKDFIAPGFISRRIDFDNFLFSNLKHYPNISVFDNCRIEKLESMNSEITCYTKDMTYSAKMAIISTGANSHIVRDIFPQNTIKDNKGSICTGLRTYYENVKALSDLGFIELYFFRDIIPGYFWIFPLPNQTANVGIGMLASHISKKKINLKKLLLNIINKNPLIAERFSNARQTDEMKAFSLPLCIEKKSISGNRFMLTGDAASLVDPFTGEGIGNAMLSGNFAAEHVKASFAASDFSADFLKQYDEKLYDRIWDEMQIGRTLHKIARHSFLLNLVINKANKNHLLHNTLINMINNTEIKNELTKPSFYFNLLFR